MGHLISALWISLSYYVPLKVCLHASHMLDNNLKIWTVIFTNILNSFYIFVLRLRAINIFIRTCHELWLRDENVGPEVMIEDLTVSIMDALYYIIKFRNEFLSKQINNNFLYSPCMSIWVDVHINIYTWKYIIVIEVAIMFVVSR